MNTIIETALNDAVSAIKQLQSPEAILFIEQAAKAIARCFQAGNKSFLPATAEVSVTQLILQRSLQGSFVEKERPCLQLCSMIRATSPAWVMITAMKLSFPGGSKLSENMAIYLLA